MDDLGRLIHEISEINRRMSNMVRHGTVHEIKKGFIRVKLGEGKGGKPFLSGWLPQGDTHSGNVREEQPFKKGQNVTLLCPGGDPAQATIWPFSPNKENKRPDHADDKQHAYQFGDLKLQRNGDHYHVQHDGSDIHLHIHKDNGVTGRVGEQVRFHAHKKGVKMRTEPSHWAIVHTEAPHLRVSEPWVIAPDDIPNDNAKIENRDDQEN